MKPTVSEHAQQINAQRRMLTLSGDRTIEYGSLLIATGSVSRRLPNSLPGATLDGVLTVHRLQDYVDLHQRLPSITDAVVIGGGLHACDTAMGLADRGIHVEWLIRRNIFLQDILGCNECLFACPAIAEPILIATQNAETLSGSISQPVAHFARTCYQCGACVAPCPVGLHRDLMMLWLKMRLRGLRRDE